MPIDLKSKLFIKPGFATKVDSFFWFPITDAVICTSDLWFTSLCVSLKLRHSVIFFETSHLVTPNINFARRWDLGQSWCWISPRILSCISLKTPSPTIEFNEFKSWLATLSP